MNRALLAAALAFSSFRAPAAITAIRNPAHRRE
jgi:hypothetical protein